MIEKLRQRAVQYLPMILILTILAACSSTSEQSQYEEYDSFAANTTDLGENQTSEQGADEYTRQESNNSSEAVATNQEMSNYENLLTENEVGEFVNNAETTDATTENDVVDNSLGGDNVLADIPEDSSAAPVSEILPQDTPSGNSGASANSLINVASEPATTTTGKSQPENSGQVSVVPEGVNDDIYVPQDVLPSYATLWWVGYNYQPNEKKLYLEIVTKGEPQYQIFQEMNQSQQPELVLRFFSTRIRDKLRRDIDASEFRSPVAYVRMRHDEVEGNTDVVLTMRDAAKPRFFAKDGNFLLTYDLPEKYLNPGMATKSGQKELSAQIVGTEDVSPTMEQGTDLPKGSATPYMPSNEMPTAMEEGQVLENVPMLSENGNPSIPNPNELPASFDTAATGNTVVPPEVQSTGPAVVSTVIPDAPPPENSAELVGNSLSGQGNIAGNDSAAALPDVAAPVPAPQPAPTQQYYPPSYARPYAQPYQNRYQPYPPVYQQPAYQAPVYQTAPTTPAAGSTESVEPSEEDEIEGSGFDDDDSLEDFEGDSDEDAIEKFEVRFEQPQIEFYASQHAMAVAQYEGGDLTAADTGDFPGAGLTNPAATNYTGGNYDYEPDAAPVAEVTDLSGTTEEVPPESYSGKLISIEFHDAVIANVLKAFTDQTGINFVFPVDISNIRISVKLRSVPWDAALKAILDANSLAMSRVTESIVKIDRNDKIKDYLKYQNELAVEQAKTLATKVLVFRLSYANAQQLATTLNTLLQDPNRILPRPVISTDTRTNSLIIEAIPQVLSKAKAIIQRMDTPNLQAEIAARIVEVSKSAQNFLGVQWGGEMNYDSGRGLGFGSLNFPNSLNARYSIDAGRQSATSGDFNFRFGSINGLIDLDLRLQMEEQLNNSETLQSQKIIVRDGENATIVSGKTDRFQEAVVVGQGINQGAQVGGLIEVNNDVNLSINNLQISNDDMVTLPLVITSNSDAPTGGDSVSSSFRREIRTTLVSRSGETVVIGGAYSTTKNSGYKGVPILSSIPIIGALFRQKSSVEDSKELLVMLTPNILSPDRSGTKQIDSLAPTTAPAASNYENGGAVNGTNYQENTSPQNGNAGGNNAEPDNYGANEAEPASNNNAGYNYNALDNNAANTGNEVSNTGNTNAAANDNYNANTGNQNAANQYDNSGNQSNEPQESVDYEY